jgi:hypothetical protein
MDDLFGVWEQNVATVRALNYALKQTGTVKADLAKDLVNHLKSCATALVKPSTDGAEARTKGEPKIEGSTSTISQNGIDKSALPIGELKRGPVPVAASIGSRLLLQAASQYSIIRARTCLALK